MFPLSSVIIVENLALPSQKLDRNLSNLCFLNRNIQTKLHNQAPELLIRQDHSMRQVNVLLKLS